LNLIKDTHWANYTALIHLYLSSFVLVGHGIKNAEVFSMIIGCWFLFYSIVLTQAIMKELN
jgi:ABC-type multidrug transport system permease subunit